MITNSNGNNTELCDFYNDPKRRERENDYINKETFPTLDLSIEGIQESMSKVCKECQQGQELLEEIDSILAIIYSKISAFSTCNNPCFSIQSVSELDSLVKEYEVKRTLIYETLNRKVSLKNELELLYLDLIRKQYYQQVNNQSHYSIFPDSLEFNLTQKSPNSCSDWSMINEVEHDSQSSSFEDCFDNYSDGDQDDESMLLDISVSGSHSTNFEYIQQI